VVFIHVPRCDRFGNAQIDGALIEDFELARAARRLVVTTEQVIPEEDIGDWLARSRSPKGTEEYFANYVHGVPDFAAYLELVGGPERMAHLADAEHLRAPMTAPWPKGKR
jgi:hypothetical protein